MGTAYAPTLMIGRLATLTTAIHAIAIQVPDAQIYSVSARSYDHLTISTQSRGQEIADALGLHPDTGMNHAHGEKTAWWTGDYEGMTVEVACDKPAAG